MKTPHCNTERATFFPKGNRQDTERATHLAQENGHFFPRASDNIYHGMKYSPNGETHRIHHDDNSLAPENFAVENYLSGIFS